MLPHLDSSGPVVVPGVSSTSSGSEELSRDVLELVLTLCQELDSRRVAYCHWKSNEALARSASGENDLDLLVGRHDVQSFEEILGRLGFKEAALPPWKSVPGLSHWYGLDSPSGRLVHVHAHYQLVVGDDMTKNIRLPIEDVYLDSRVASGPFRVPAPEFELGLFVIRMVLKHCVWDAILMRQGALSASERRELVDLTAQVDANEVGALMERHLAVMNGRLWARCLRSIQSNTSAWVRASSARKLQSALVSCRRRPWAVDTPLKIGRRLRVVVRRKVFRRDSLRAHLRAGGKLIAVVGGDGAGKSTVVEGVSRWLGEELLTRTMHLGKPSRSPISVVLRSLMRLAASVKPSPVSSAHALRSSLATPGHEPMTIRNRARLVWEVLTARDRYRAFRRARRAVRKGAIVVCDRYPLPEVRLMDGAVTVGAEAANRGRIIELLARREQRYYERIASPDLLLVLKVEPDVAVLRKRGQEREGFVRPRSEEIWRKDWHGSEAHVIDAGRSEADVLAEVRSLVWSEL